MGFSKQGYCGGLPFPFSKDLPDPVIETVSRALAGGFFTTEPPEAMVKNMSYSGINLTKNGQELYIENYKIVLREFKEILAYS